MFGRAAGERLASHPTLRRLNLGRNRFGPAGLANIAAAYAKAPGAGLTAIELHEIGLTGARPRPSTAHTHAHTRTHTRALHMEGE